MLLGTAAIWQARCFVALGREQLVGDAHLDVVGLAGEQQQRLVLRLPAEPRDRAVVAVVVGLAADGAAGTGSSARPRIPRPAFAAALAARLARIAESGICSIRPAPNTGVGMRKITLWLATCVAKSGCASVQPVAPTRPVIVKSAWTPPSGVPSGLRTKRASRTGPFAERKDGMMSVPPSAFANAICGFDHGARAADRRLQSGSRRSYRGSCAGPCRRPRFSSSAKSACPATKYSALARRESADDPPGAGDRA